MTTITDLPIELNWYILGYVGPYKMFFDLTCRDFFEISKKNIAKHLHESGFTNIFKDVEIPATESYVKEIDGLEMSMPCR